VHDELARWKGWEARRCGHVMGRASMVFTPATIVEFGPAFTNGRTQSNANKGFPNHQMLPVNHQMPSKSLLIPYDVINECHEKAEGLILNKKPIVGVLVILLANYAGLQLGWKFASRYPRSERMALTDAFLVSTR
jgi:hypothetical protein